MHAVGADLGRRGRIILEATVERYIRTGEPVASRSVARLVDPPVSPATARNEMAQLEARGFLCQPHTSAGRVPTDRGYRVYVDGLLAPTHGPPRRAPADALAADALAADAFAASDARLVGEARALDMNDYLRVVSAFLSERSDQVGVVLSPATSDEVLEQLQFVRMGVSRVMALAVSRLGAVSSRILETEAALDDRELALLQDALNTRLRGRTFRDARRILTTESRRSRWSSLLAPLLPLGVLPLEKAHEAEVFVEGVANMLKPDPFADLERIRRAVAALERKQAPAHLALATRGDEGVTIRIGQENEPEPFSDLALIACSYGDSGCTRGSLGVLGPKRMDYSRLIPLVIYTAERVSAFVRSRDRVQDQDKEPPR